MNIEDTVFKYLPENYEKLDKIEREQAYLGTQMQLQREYEEKEVNYEPMGRV